jgi:aryl-alcohol dehydrogenase-like predicted oxidoreductase
VTATISGRPVARIGFGAMQLPGPGVFGPPRDRDAALAVLRRAIELGVNHIDTAQYYGPDVSNELIHEALHPYPDDLVLVSKVGGRRNDEGGWLPAQTPAELRTGVEDNLRSLEVDRVDAVNLRLMGAEAPAGFDPVDYDAQLDEMSALCDEGKIGGVGLSTVTLDQLDHALDRGVELTCVQNAFSLVSRDDEPVLALCRERGIAYVPYFPLGSAFPGMAKVTEQAPVIEVAQRRDATPAQVGLAWVLAQGDNVLLIPGTSSVAHLEENLGAADVTLSDADLELLATVPSTRPPH